MWFSALLSWAFFSDCCKNKENKHMDTKSRRRIGMNSNMGIDISILLLLFSHPVMSNTLQPHGLQQASSPCASPSTRVCPSSCPSSLLMPSSHLILWCPLFLLPPIFPSIRDFSNESAVSIRWPKYWSFSFSITPSNKYSGLISLQIDWLDCFAAQGTFRSLLQYHSLKASIFCPQLSLQSSSQNYTWTLGRP